MSRYITLGADESGEVYGLEVNDDGTWRRNSLGLSTNCVVIRPVTKENYEYMTEDPESVEDLWKAAVAPLRLRPRTRKLRRPVVASTV